MPDKSAYLNAMGIDVWLERNRGSHNAAVASVAPNSHAVEQPPSQSPPQQSAVVRPSANKTPIKENAAKIEETAANESSAFNTIDVSTLDWPMLEKQVSSCELCGLATTRTCTLLGAGNKKASLMLIGEAPTAEDESQQSVFSGEAGTLLTAMLKAMGYQRTDVYLTNTVKCKTQSNQNPSELELSACEPYLLQQINLVQPELIIVLGNVAAQSLLKSKSTMSRLRGQLHYIDGVKAPVLVSYHPTYLLAAANEKRKAWQDLQLAMKELAS